MILLKVRIKIAVLVAQLDRAIDFGSIGYGFKSYRAHHISSTCSSVG